MANKQQIQAIKENNERTLQGLRTGFREFIYDETGGYVKPDKLYSVYYTLTKKQVYLTGIQNTYNSKIINKVVENDLFARYSKIKTSTRQDYPGVTPAVPTDTDYKNGSITRYFTQIGNDKTKPVFEVSVKDYDKQNDLYKYTQINWRITGKKQEVERDNQLTINSLLKEYPTITKTLTPLQFWIPSKDSRDTIENKLKRLKKT